MAKQTIERQLAVQLKPTDNGKSLVFDIPKEVLEKEPFSPKYYIREKNKDELIKYFEKLIRDSFEYKWLIDIFKTILDVKSCVFFKGYSIDNGMKLEFHHHPFTLYDYVEAAVNRQLTLHNDDDHGNYVYENEVMKETVMIHYKFMVGLVPLDPTSHALVHDHKLEIPPQLIIGNYEKFYSDYYNFISEAAKAKYDLYQQDYPVGVELEYPESYKYKPIIVNASNKQLITTEKVDRILLSDKLNHVSNSDISKIIGGK